MCLKIKVLDQIFTIYSYKYIHKIGLISLIFSILIKPICVCSNKISLKHHFEVDEVPGCCLSM